FRGPEAVHRRCGPLRHERMKLTAVFLLLLTVLPVSAAEPEVVNEQLILILRKWDLRNYYYNAKYHVENEQWDKAMFAIQKVLEIEPENTEARRLIGLVEEKRWEEFKKMFDDKRPVKKTIGLKQDWERVDTFGEPVTVIKTDARKYLELAEHKFETGDIDSAESYYKTTVSHSPRSSIAYRRLGEIYFIAGDEDLSRYCLLKTLEFNPADQLARLLLANQMLLLRDYDSAGLLLGQILDIDPVSEIAVMAKGLQYRIKREKAVFSLMAEQKIDEEKFIEFSQRQERELASYSYGYFYYLEKAREGNPDFWFSYYLLSYAHMMTFRKDKALACLEEAYDRAPSSYRNFLSDLRKEMAEQELRPYQFDSTDFHIARAEMLYRKEFYTDAIGELVVALSIDPNSAAAHVMMGKCFSAMNNFTRSISEYRQAISLDPKSFEGFFLLGCEYIKIHQYEDAVDSIRNALVLEPNNVDAHLKLAEAFYNVEDFLSALDIYKKVLTIDPTVPRAHSSIGVIYTEQAEYDKAISSFEKAIEYKKDYVDAYANLGIVYYNLWEIRKDPESLNKAISYTEEALKYEPGNPQLIDFLTFFKSKK
ncbi:MAG: tetratricopeptide repeat protein, partial [Candidatus Wallbacteria bacterium]|nr:tetratricopeptide repeat protein [Candidatus Wallbacteria bacterium]